MHRLTISFLLFAIVAAFFGFGGIIISGVTFCKVFFYVFTLLFFLSAIGSGAFFKK